MITIVKGKSKLLVSKGTFEEQYKALGYQIASNDKGATDEVAPIVKEKEIEDKQEKVEEQEKISQKYGFKTKKGK